MVRRFIAFLRGLSTNWVGTLGVVLTSTAFVLFVVVEALRALGVITNAYVGLITYMTLPALFVLGLLLVPVGWWIFKRARRRTTSELFAERFESRLTGRTFIAMFGGLTLVNLLFLGVGTARMLHFMDQPSFCGTACHGVMQPEWAAYQNSTHAHVRCVDCHVGEGAGAMVDAKLNGLRQLYGVMTDSYPRPIPTPVTRLRAARHTCGACHSGATEHGEVVRTLVGFEPDEASTPRFTTLAFKIGPTLGPGEPTIHWHTAPGTRVRFASLDGEQSTITWVVVERADGSTTRYANREIEVPWAREVMRVMDCVDCHNRVGHSFGDPEAIVDHLISTGEIDRALPFAKRTALAALSRKYPDREAADLGIERRFAGFYADQYPVATASRQGAIDRAVAALRREHARNVHHGMRVGWNTYADHRGHRHDRGCFRCHNSNLVDRDGSSISSECTLCHSVLAWDSDSPFAFLEPLDDEDPEIDIHEFLRDEYLRRKAESGRRPAVGGEPDGDTPAADEPAGDEPDADEPDADEPDGDEPDED